MTRRTILVLCGLFLTLAATRFEAALWIDSVSDDGAVIVLSDDSTWQVEFADQVKASLWLSMQRVAIAKTSRVSIYRIVREQQGDSVQAKPVRR
jgi:hypothetical protein